MVSHLREQLKKPNFLPQMIKVGIDLRKDISISTILSKTLTGRDIKKIIKKRFKEDSNPIILTKQNNLLISDLKNNSTFEIHDDKTPIRLMCQSDSLEIVLQGELKFQKGEKCCIKRLYQGVPIQTKYYTCLDCNNKRWICEGCIEKCHAGHQITLFMEGKFDSATCYCKKTKQ